MELIADLYLRAIAQALPVLVAAAAWRRLWRSRSVNRFAYLAILIFALIAVVGVSGGVLSDRPMEAGALAMALLTMPLWLALREVLRRLDITIAAPSDTSQPLEYRRAVGPAHRRLQGPAPPR